jgi:hypothetical protein
MPNGGYESNSSDDDTQPIYIPPKTRRKKFRKTRSNQLMLKQLISKTKKLNLGGKAYLHCKNGIINPI